MREFPHKNINYENYLNMSEKKCPTCGFEIINDANYCFNCGAALKNPMPEIKYLKEELEEAPIEEIAEEEIEQPTLEESVVELVEQQETCEITEEEEQERESEEECDESEEEEKSRRILWMPEWAFYSALLIVGIIGIVTYKFISDPSWAEKLDFSSVNEENAAQVDGIDASKDLSVSIVDAEYDNSVYTPLMNALDGEASQNPDSTYHVVVMTLKSLESAQGIVDGGKFKNAYIISDSTLHRIAVYSNDIKEEAQRHLDTVVKNGVKGAWVFHGPKK